MKAIVLVGGEGTRLRPLTLTTPKPLLPIANQPFLERQLEWLASYGVDDVVLSMGYLPDAFAAHFAGGSFKGISLRYAVEEKPLGTAGGIRFAAGDIDERVIVCNGDVLTTLDLGAMVAFHEAAGAEATISLTQVDDPSAFGVVPTHPDGEVVGFIEKPPRELAPTNWINAGTYVLEPSVLGRIPERMAVSIEREIFPRMVETPRTLFAFQSDSYWLDIGTPEKYVQAHLDLLDGANLLGDGAQVAPDARIERSSIGPRVTVGAEATIEASVVLEGAVIGAGARVVDSIVGPGARIGDGVTLEHLTVVGKDTEVAPGARLSAARVPGSA